MWPEMLERFVTRFSPQADGGDRSYMHICFNCMWLVIILAYRLNKKGPRRTRLDRIYHKSIQDHRSEQKLPLLVDEIPNGPFLIGEIPRLFQVSISVSLSHSLSFTHSLFLSNSVISLNQSYLSLTLSLNLCFNFQVSQLGVDTSFDIPPARQTRTHTRPHPSTQYHPPARRIHERNETRWYSFVTSV